MLANHTACPHCNNPLEERDRHGVAIGFCPKCRGVWLNRGELDTIIERAGRFLEIRSPPARDREHPGERLRKDNFDWF
jgi:Zn-finger nucleic acid-binding protein